MSREWKGVVSAEDAMKTKRACVALLSLLAILLVALACAGTRATQRGEGSGRAAAQGFGPGRYFLPLVSGDSTCAVARDTVLTEGAIGPSWIPWDSPCLPDADLVYVRPDTWDLWVMDEHGGHQRCLTCYGDNVLGVNFPLDEDGRPPTVHWKGGPEVHPTAPIIILKAENENSAHSALRNLPSLGWDNDLWALNVCTRHYSRLTQLAPDQGTQHTGISNDGRWFAYPLRYQYGDPLRNFGLARLVIAELSVDGAGDAHLLTRMDEEPNGPMYYEPSDIQSSASGSWTLLYAAGDSIRLDPYNYE